jgi:hypothetical protein
MSEVNWEEEYRSAVRELAQLTMSFGQVKFQLEAAMEELGALPPENPEQIRIRTGREVQRMHDILVEMIERPDMRKELFPGEEMRWLFCYADMDHFQGPGETRRPAAHVGPAVAREMGRPG